MVRLRRDVCDATKIAFWFCSAKNRVITLVLHIACSLYWECTSDPPSSVTCYPKSSSHHINNRRRASKTTHGAIPAAIESSMALRKLGSFREAIHLRKHLLPNNQLLSKACRTRSMALTELSRGLQIPEPRCKWLLTI